MIQKTKRKPLLKEITQARFANRPNQDKTFACGKRCKKQKSHSQ